jgi:hypothetical protein
MKRKRLNAMPALPEFLVLLGIFVLASNVNAFTSLSLVSGNQFRVNHLIQSQQPMSDPMNEPSREPIREPTNDRKKTLSFNDKSSSKFQLVVASIANECSKGLSKKTDQCTMNNSRQSRSFIGDVSIDSWQCPID